MDIQELKQFIEDSDFSPETKQKVTIVLAGKAVLDYDTYAGVKEILQQELDNDFKSAGVDLTGDAQAEIMERNYEAELEQINTELEKDKKFIEEETNKLNEMNRVIDRIEAEAV